MSYSKEQKRKVNEDMREADRHAKHGTVDGSASRYAAHDLRYHTGPVHGSPHIDSGEPGNDFERKGERENQEYEDRKRGK